MKEERSLNLLKGMGKRSVNEGHSKKNLLLIKHLLNLKPIGFKIDFPLFSHLPILFPRHL